MARDYCMRSLHENMSLKQICPIASCEKKAEDFARNLLLEEEGRWASRERETEGGVGVPVVDKNNLCNPHTVIRKRGWVSLFQRPLNLSTPPDRKTLKRPKIEPFLPPLPSSRTSQSSPAPPAALRQSPPARVREDH